MAEAAGAVTDFAAWDARLAEVLPPESLFAVGGRVRDEIRAQNRGVPCLSKDADYVVVGIDYTALAKRLTPLFTIDIVGASFSVMKVTYEGSTVDVALPRREFSTGPGHREFSIESGPAVRLEDDLARRDFRMNMIARAIPSGTLIDPYAGAADILAHRIDILNEQAFLDDPLRMLRACQFAARFDFAVSARTLAAMQAAASLVTTVSPQRVGEELAKFLTAAHRPSIGIELMREAGLLAHIWPELLEGVDVAQNEWHAYDVYQHNLHTLDAAMEGDLVARLAALLHDVGKPRVKDGGHFYRHEYVGEELARDMLTRTSFSNSVNDQVCHLIRQHMYCTDETLTQAAVRRFIRRIGTESLDQLFSLRAADIVGSGLPKRDDANEIFQTRVAQELLQAPPLNVRNLVLDGTAVMAALRAAGLTVAPRGDRRVGAALQALLEIVTDDPTQNTILLLDAHLARIIPTLVA